MNKLLLIIMIAFLFIGCGGDFDKGSSGDETPDDGSEKQCENNSDCPFPYECNLETFRCIDPKTGEDMGDSGNTGDTAEDPNKDDPCYERSKNHLT